MNLQQSAQPGVPRNPLLSGRSPAERLSRKPSIETLLALLVAKQGADLDLLIVRLRSQTCEAYAQYGVGAEPYEQAFDDLHWCRMLRMALDFRVARGLPPDARTPFDDDDLVVWLDEVRKAQGHPEKVSA